MNRRQIKNKVKNERGGKGKACLTLFLTGHLNTTKSIYSVSPLLVLLSFITFVLFFVYFDSSVWNVPKHIYPTHHEHFKEKDTDIKFIRISTSDRAS